MARGGFPGMPGGNMQQMLKQAQKMQQNITKLQAELEAREYEATSGGGMVYVKANGKKELLELTERIRADGFPVVVEPTDYGTTEFFESCVLDPDGVRVEIGVPAWILHKERGE